MKRKLLTKSNLIWLSVLIGAALLHLLFFISENVADFFNTNIAHYIRFTLAKITDLFPFSVGEMLVFLAIPFAFVLAVIAIKKEKTLKSKLCLVLLTILKIVIVLYLLFVCSFAPGYGGSGLDEKLGFQRETAKTEELYKTLVYVIEQTNELSSQIDYCETDASYMPFDLDELSHKLCATYEKIYSEYSQEGTFNSSIKPLIVSPIMTYTHISGMYSFFTGEANLNTNYPDFVSVFSTAHEFAHQRGIAREDEANFMAYLICISSDDNYIKYSGYLNMFSYLSEALYFSDAELYKNAVSKLSVEARNELTAYSKFFEKYRTNTASVISDKLNDTYLRSQGTSGSISYSMVVDLAVAYHKTTDNK